MATAERFAQAFVKVTIAETIDDLGQRAESDKVAAEVVRRVREAGVVFALEAPPPDHRPPPQR